MKITIRLFAVGCSVPRFTGELVANPDAIEDGPTDVDQQDIRLLWNVERAINNYVAGRCHIEITEK